MGLSVSREGNLPIGQTREESQKLLNQTKAAALLPHALDFSTIDDMLNIVNSSVLGELLTIRELCAVERTLRSSIRLLQQLEQVSFGGESSERPERKRNMENLEFLLKETSMRVFQSGGIDKPLITKLQSLGSSGSSKQAPSMSSEEDESLYSLAVQT